MLNQTTGGHQLTVESEQLPALLAMLICEDCPMSEDGVVSLSRVVDTFNVIIVVSAEQPRDEPPSDEELQEIPAPIRCWLFTKWGTGNGQFEETVTIVRPDDTEVKGMPSTIFTLTGGFRFYQVRHQMNLSVRRPGLYKFRVHLNGRMIGEHPFMVNIKRTVQSSS